MFDEKKVAAARDTLLAACKELNAKSIISSWTTPSGTKVELTLTINPLDEVEDDERAKCANLPDAESRDVERALAKKHVQEEMSDVKIMLMQLAEIFGFSREWEKIKLAHLRSLVMEDKKP